MKTINYLETRLSSRYDEFDPDQDGNKNTQFSDFIIDGRSLYQMLRKHDRVPSLGWGVEEHQRNMIDYFLLKRKHDYLYDRYPLLVCPWCGDEECGFISVYIEREDDRIIWQDFKIEPSNQGIDIGPFYFKWDNYEKEINSAFGTTGSQ